MMTAPGFFKRRGIIELARDTAFYAATPNSATPSSDARSIGTAMATRRVYALIAWWHGSNSRTLTGATIGGVTASILIQSSGSILAKVAIIYADVPTGTTAVVACTFSGAVAHFIVGVIALARVKSGTPVDAQECDFFFGTASIDALAGGYIMGIGQTTHNFSTSNITWSFLTEGTEQVLNDGSVNFVVSMAYKARLPVLTDQSIDVDSSPTNSGNAVLVSVR